ncbi:hypothetical protein [Wenzhouxiangella sp. EGI_FJ10409]|uniref:hypothetical protein n=1 Tax=Wenzhouxiangella sp. EGI_FJ10409 TaxID=3243767 RepID=UPI0035D9FAE0
MKTSLAFCLAFGLALATGPAQAEDEPDMIGTMGSMQLFLHKLSLSVAAGNRELIDFYAHELEETIEAAESIEEYHDIPVGQLTEAMLVPAFEAFEEAVDEDAAEDPAKLDRKLGELIQACNACHQATGYEFIHIERNESNPYMQRFEPRD